MNTEIFSSTIRNAAGGRTLPSTSEQALAQFAVTGCFGDTFYATAKEQLASVLRLSDGCSDVFLSQLIMYSKTRGHMRDMPVVLLAKLTTRNPKLTAEIFDQVIDSVKLLRNYVQVLRSDVVGRRSLGSFAKNLVRKRLDKFTDEQVFYQSTGDKPSLADVIKMIHPKPKTPERSALYRYIIGKPVEAIPDCVKSFENFRATRECLPSNLPFQMLAPLLTKPEHWNELALTSNWTATRMNLNTFQRHGAFENPGIVEVVATRLANEDLIRRAKAMPYQLLAAIKATGSDVPTRIRMALELALQSSLRNVPVIPGNVYVFLDTSGSMQNLVSGHGQSSVRCIDVAALFAAAVVNKNPNAKIVPFDTQTHKAEFNPLDTVSTVAMKLASYGGGGTNCSLPMYELSASRAPVDTIIYISDNESWVDANLTSMAPFLQVKSRNRQAKLICIDITPSTAKIAGNCDDVLNIGGFNDEVFTVIERFLETKGTNRDFFIDTIKQNCAMNASCS